MKLALIAAPVLALYLPTVPLPKFATKRVLPMHRESVGFVQPRDEAGVNRGSRGGVVFANRVGGAVFATKRVLPNTASPTGSFSPVMKLALIAAPVVASYLPTVPPLAFATKRVLPDTASPSGTFSPVMKLALISGSRGGVVFAHDPSAAPGCR